MARSKKLLFSISHACFTTDTIGRTTSIVEATSPGEAIGIFNRLAEKRRDYPYCWSDAHAIDRVEVIRES